MPLHLEWERNLSPVFLNLQLVTVLILVYQKYLFPVPLLPVVLPPELDPAVALGPVTLGLSTQRTSKRLGPPRITHPV